MRFNVTFLNSKELLAKYHESQRYFDGLFTAYKKGENFILIEDERFEDVSRAYTQVIKDFKLYKFLHPIKMAGYKVGKVMLWEQTNKSIILSIKRNW